MQNITFSALSYAEKISQILNVIVSKLSEWVIGLYSFSRARYQLEEISTVKNHKIDVIKYRTIFICKILDRRQRKCTKSTHCVKLISVKFSKYHGASWRWDFYLKREFYENRPRQENIFHECLVVLRKFSIFLPGFAISSDHIYRLFVDFILHPISPNDTLQHDCVDLDYIDLVNCSSSCTSCVILCHY